MKKVTEPHNSINTDDHIIERISFSIRLRAGLSCSFSWSPLCLLHFDNVAQRGGAFD